MERYRTTLEKADTDPGYTISLNSTAFFASMLDCFHLAYISFHYPAYFDCRLCTKMEAAELARQDNLAGLAHTHIWAHISLRTPFVASVLSYTWKNDGVLST
jgi:hypothetical protein